MQLYGKQRGDTGTPVLVLHGLFGASDNLLGLARVLQENHQVHLLDLRNHGRSPRSNTMTYEEMASDIIEYLDLHDIQACNIIGHSMGGKVAMEVALNNPERVSKLIVADIAPVTYESNHNEIFNGLKAVDLDVIKSRTEADHTMASFVQSASVRQFLVKSLYKSPEGGFLWRFNLPILIQEYSNILSGLQGNREYIGPVLFIAGGDSDYVQPVHREDILSKFPSATLKIIPDASHWLHAEKPQLFNTLCHRFLG